MPLLLPALELALIPLSMLAYQTVHLRVQLPGLRLRPHLTETLLIINHHKCWLGFFFFSNNSSYRNI